MDRVIIVIQKWMWICFINILQFENVKNHNKICEVNFAVIQLAVAPPWVWDKNQRKSRICLTSLRNMRRGGIQGPWWRRKIRLTAKTQHLSALKLVTSIIKLAFCPLSQHVASPSTQRSHTWISRIMYGIWQAFPWDALLLQDSDVSVYIHSETDAFLDLYIKVEFVFIWLFPGFFDLSLETLFIPSL